MLRGTQPISMALQAKFWYLFFYAYFPFLFVSGVFVVLKNHHAPVRNNDFEIYFSIFDLKNEKYIYFVSSLTVSFCILNLCHCLPKLICNKSMEFLLEIMLNQIRH